MREDSRAHNRLMNRPYSGGLLVTVMITVILAARVQAGDVPLDLDVGGGVLLLKRSGLAFPISLKCPRLAFETETIGGEAPLGVEGEITSGRPVEVSYAPIPLKDGGLVDVQLFLQWSADEAMVRKWAAFQLTGRGAPLLLKEVILEDVETGGQGTSLVPKQAVFSAPMSYPIFFDGLYMGVEFPVASTRLADGRAVLAHMPGRRVQPAVPYETRKAVYGITPPGKELRGFQQYIANRSPGTTGRMFAWETWISVPIPYTEQDHLDLLEMIGDNLYQRHGTSIDACVMTAGWSNPRSIWEIDKERFPEGFTRVREAAARMECKMGLWISPSSYYSFAQDAKWAGEQGYESTVTAGQYPRSILCLGGKRYQNLFKERLLDLFARYDIAYAYFDGYLFQCDETGHGHEPGRLSAEAIAEGLIDVFQSLRKIKPDVWLESTAFGGNASPWWLFHVNTVLGNYGDDCPWGRVPAPVYRESYTTARDYYNLQGCCHGLLPSALQEVFGGLYNHSREPVVNDAVMGVMRGSSVDLLCTNPKVMSDYGWAALARMIDWTRENSVILRNTQPLLPASWSGGNCPQFSHDAPAPREPYGYAHWESRRGIVAVRNPWIVPQTYSLRLDENTDLSPQADGLSAVSIYPENRVYGKSLKFGDTLSVPLAPYEMVVLAIEPGGDLQGIDDVSTQIGNRVGVAGIEKEVCRVEFRGGSDKLLGPDWTSTVGSATTSLKLCLDADVTIQSSEGELLVLSEEKSQPIQPICRLLVNGREAPAVLSGPDVGFASTVASRPEQWLMLRFPLAEGENHVHLEVLSRSESPTMSAWAWATKAGEVDGSSYPNSLPQPEHLSLDAVQILAPVALEDPDLAVQLMEQPVERIEGVFLDSLEPASASGTVVKNTSPSQGPITVRGRKMLRGLGVVAPARVSFDLSGKYGRFESLVGVDGGTGCHDKSTLVFEVWLDGEKRWESPELTRWDEPLPVSVGKPSCCSEIADAPPVERFTGVQPITAIPG